VEGACEKKPIFLKTQNKHLYWLYSNEILDIKALEYNKYFTHIDLWRTLKNSQLIHAIVETKFRMYGQAVSKSMPRCMAKRMYGQVPNVWPSPVEKVILLGFQWHSLF
jgi:hypothetical protein